MIELMNESIVNPIAEFSIPADSGGVRRASAWLETACIERGVPQSQISRLELCLNEALANVVSHSGKMDRSSPIRLRLNVHQNQSTNEVLVTISDSGAPFDPLSKPAKSRPKSLADAEPGGLGLIMIRHFSDKQDYRYVDGSNQLSFSVCWAKLH